MLHLNHEAKKFCVGNVVPLISQFIYQRVLVKTKVHCRNCFIDIFIFFDNYRAYFYLLFYAIYFVVMYRKRETLIGISFYAVFFRALFSNSDILYGG